jgi:hypothetical protein
MIVKFKGMTIGSVMALVFLSGLILAAFRHASMAWARATFAMTVLVFLTALLRGIALGGSHKTSWTGFAAFGLAFLHFGAPFFHGRTGLSPLVPFAKIDELTMTYLSIPYKTTYVLPDTPMENPTAPLKPGYRLIDLRATRLICHATLALLAACLGAVLGLLITPKEQRRGDACHDSMGRVAGVGPPTPGPRPTA